MVLFCSKLGAVFSYKVQPQNRGKERHAASMQRSSTGSSRATAFPESSGTALVTELASHHGLPGEKHLQEQVRHIHSGRHHFSFRRSPCRVPKALAIDSAAALFRLSPPHNVRSPPHRQTPAQPIPQYVSVPRAVHPTLYLGIHSSTKLHEWF